MSDFLLCRGEAPDVLAQKMLDRLGRGGLGFTPLVDSHGMSLLWRGHHAAKDSRFFRSVENEWILCTGLFSFRNQSGRRGLEAFLRAFDPAAPDLAGTLGQFTLVIRKSGRLYLLSDALGCNKIYHDGEHRLFSNLFVAVAEGLESPRLDPQACYEYVWNGVPAAGRCFFGNMKSLPAGQMAAFEGDAAPRLSALPTVRLREEESGGDGSMAAAGARQCARLQEVMESYRQAHGERVNLLFSGGYDSRLLLALLLSVGIRPRLTVYGRPGDRDREIAAQVARAEGLAFNPVDKSAFATPQPSEYRDAVMADYAAFDGWRVTGLFDSGVDRLDRQAQVADGAAKMNGSLGEIYRNFFYLPDRPFTARQLVRCFYARYDPRAMTAAFDAAAYETSLADAIMADVGAEAPRLSRSQVELAYPLFRGRYWTAREVPLNQAFGTYLTPFMEPAAIKGTPDWRLPWKSHGRVEAAMIARLSPRLAAYPSVYGRPFDQPPSTRERLRSLSTYHRPIALRRLSYRLQQRRARSLPDFLSPAHLASVMEPGFPYMRALFQCERVADGEAFNRIATLEFLAQRYGAREF